MERQLAGLEAEAKASETRITAYQQLLAQADDIAAGYRHFLEARVRQTQLDEKVGA